MISFHKHLTPTAVKERLGELTRPTGTEDILTIDYPEVKQLRWRIEPAVALKLAAVIVVIAVGFLGWQRYFKPPEPHHPFPMPAAAAAPTEEPTSTASPASLVVSVVGEVEHPGLHTLVPDARIADALAAAQPYPHGQTLGLNLAQKLTDGQQIHVPHVDAGEVIPVDSTTGGASGAAGTAVNTTGTDGKISLNSATAEQLESLDGVGAKTAQAIIAYREANGGFSDIAQLQEVKGIGPAKFAAISPQVSL